MLLGNYTALNSNPGRAIGGFTNLKQNFKGGTLDNFSYQYDPNMPSLEKASFPTATEGHYAFLMAWVGGELSSSTGIMGTGAIAGNAAMGRAIAANLAGSGAIVSALSLITSLSASLAGSGALTASMASILSMAATLAGSGNITAALALLVKVQAALAGSGAIASDLKAKAHLAAEIFVNSGTATVNELVAGVWNAVASDFNESGTMGQKLNGAGSAGDPWTTDLSSYTTEGTAGKKLKDSLSEDNFLALK